MTDARVEAAAMHVCKQGWRAICSMCFPDRPCQRISEPARMAAEIVAAADAAAVAGSEGLEGYLLTVASNIGLTISAGDKASVNLSDARRFTEAAAALGAQRQRIAELEAGLRDLFGMRAMPTPDGAPPEYIGMHVDRRARDRARSLLHPPEGKSDNGR